MESTRIATRLMIALMIEVRGMIARSKVAAVILVVAAMIYFLQVLVIQYILMEILVQKIMEILVQKMIFV